MNWKNRQFRMKSTILFMALMACVMTALTGPLNFDEISIVYAKDYSHSSSQTNYCGDGSLASNIFCSNQESEVQGDENVISAAGRSSGSNTAPLDVAGQTGNDITPAAASEDKADSQNDIEENTVSHEDPTLLVLPCCDEMPGDSSSSGA